MAGTSLPPRRFAFGRLSRKLADSLRIKEQLDFAGLRPVFVSQGIDSGSEQAEFLLATHGIVDSLYIGELAKKVYRGVEGRALRGLHTGGRCFGYRNVPIEDPARNHSYGRPVIVGVRLVVDEAEATIVRRIFQLYASGYSLKRLAKLLNAERVPSPQPQKGRISRSWCPSSLRTILHNERYRGVVVWGKTRKLRSPRTGKRVYRRRAETEWLKVEAPEQRIVSEQLWQQVQARMEQVKRLYGFDDPERKTGLLRSRAIGSQYLFSGLLKCGVCGANITIVAGRGRNHASASYGCPMNALRGESVCSNSMRVRRDVLERDLLAGLQERVLREEVVEYTLEGFERELAKALDNLGGELEGMRQRKSELEEELCRLTAAVAELGHSPSLLEGIVERERELRSITDRLLEARPDSVQGRVKAIRNFVVSRLADLRSLLSADVTDVLTLRAELSKHVERITLQPDGRIYVASGSWDLLGDGAMGVCRGRELDRTSASGL